jgi:MOSC domain-containing protein
MPIEIGYVEAIFRYPVKSMAAEKLESASLGWHGLEGDRRFAFRRVSDQSGFPWLSASKLPDLLLFKPCGFDNASPQNLPTHIRTPNGDELPIFSDALAEEIVRRHGAPVQMMHLRSGIFDDASVSVITSETVSEIAGLAGCTADARRFRPNVVARLLRPHPFQEGDWLGSELSFGDGDDAATVSVNSHDIRCSVISLDPESARPAPEMLKAVVRANENKAGIYGAVTRTGRIAVGQSIFLNERSRGTR